jgi:DNA-binding response OmpR family regulator
MLTFLKNLLNQNNLINLLYPILNSIQKTMSIRQILIIDDEMEVCILLEHYLTKKNKKILFSTNLSDGIDKFKQIKPDLLILDHNLPDGFGIEKISTFKSLNPSLIIVITSAMSNLKNEALEMGANYFIEKPISFSTLNEILLEH